jgi:transglutaminase-like putative cysteine protease
MSHRLTLAAAAGTILASTALYSLFTGLAWFWAGVGAAAVAAGAGTLTRLRALPAIVCLAASLAALLVYLNFLFAGTRSWLLVVPTPSSLSYLYQIAAQGLADADRLAPPVPVTPGLVLLAAAGIGLAAVAADMLAVRLRGSAVAGLPLLALFTAPAAISSSQDAVGTTIVFCLGVVGYLLILSADGRERIRAWGRTVSLWRAGGPGRPGTARAADARPLGPSGRRIGIASMVVALCVPLIVPGLRMTRLFPAHNIFGSVGSGLGSGGGAVVPNPLAAMSNELHESQPTQVLTYRSTDPAPQYLQMYVLGNLTTTNWTIGPRLGPTTAATGKLPQAPGLTSASRYKVTTHVTFSRAAASATGAVSFLPVPYPPTQISAAGHWQIDLGTSMVYAVGTSLSGFSYTVTSNDVTPTAQQLDKAAAPPAAMTSEYLGVPVPFRSLKALAVKVTKGASTSYDKAIALQQWFTQTGGFSYSLNAAVPASAAALSRFLTVTKRGYCQQFAFAMAVLARLLGIPSRIVVGYTAGTSTGNDTWVVKSSDAHAWPELYFQGAGWLRFEPTPSGAAGQGTASPPVYSVPTVTVPSGGSVPSTPYGATGTGSGTNRSSTVPRLHFRSVPGDEAGPGAASPGGGFPAVPLGIAVLGLLAALLATPWASRSVTRQRRRLFVGKPPSSGHGGAAAPAAHASEHADGAGQERTRALLNGRGSGGRGREGPAHSPGPGRPGRDAWPDSHGTGRAGQSVAAGGAGMGKAAGDAARAHAAWREVLADLADYRIGTRPSESPRAVARRVTDELGLLPPPAEALRRIALAEERASYSGSPSPAATLRPDMDLVRRGIGASASRRARWRARIFPASVLAPLCAAVARTAGAASPAALWHGRGHDRPAAEANVPDAVMH